MTLVEKAPMPARPYLTTTPWAGYTPRERPRKTPLARCPSKACARAKACVDAHDKLYCQRSHESLEQSRVRHGKPPLKPSKRPWTLEQVQTKRLIIEAQLGEAQAREKDMTERWKAGEFDAAFGKFKPGGVLKHPPVRQYTD
jgi:hypothetical protein